MNPTDSATQPKAKSSESLSLACKLAKHLQKKSFFYIFILAISASGGACYLLATRLPHKPPAIGQPVSQQPATVDSSLGKNCSEDEPTPKKSNTMIQTGPAKTASSTLCTGDAPDSH